MFLMFSFAAQAWGNVDMASPCGGLILPINRQAWRVTQAWGNVDTASCEKLCGRWYDTERYLVFHSLCQAWQLEYVPPLVFTTSLDSTMDVRLVYIWAVCGDATLGQRGSLDVGILVGNSASAKAG